jgi:hypothetical protein
MSARSVSKSEPRLTSFDAVGSFLEVTLALSNFTSDALARVGSLEAQRSLDLWLETSHGVLAGEDAKETFASEAAFAAAARAVLEARLGERAKQHGPAFPHIYEPPLFAWYHPSRELVDPLVELVNTQGEKDPTELLGWLYQFSIPEHIRKRLGHFYTSRSIVSHMLDKAEFAGADVLTGRLIDPACGAGAFLAEAARRVLAAAD